VTEVSYFERKAVKSVQRFTSSLSAQGMMLDPAAGLLGRFDGKTRSCSTSSPAVQDVLREAEKKKSGCEREQDRVDP
jgi:hypothetical protein